LVIIFFITLINTALAGKFKWVNVAYNLFLMVGLVSYLFFIITPNRIERWTVVGVILCLIWLQFSKKAFKNRN